MQGFWELSQEYCEINVSLHEELIEVSFLKSSCPRASRMQDLRKCSLAAQVAFCYPLAEVVGDSTVGISGHGVDRWHCHRQCWI